MSQIISRVLRLKSATWFSRAPSGDLHLCDEILRKLFCIPRTCRKIRLSLHTRPDPDRVRMKVGRHAIGLYLDRFKYIIAVHVEDRPKNVCRSETAISVWWLSDRLEPLFGRPLYLECELLD